ncbi:MAG: peptidoglycan editing factor PgeF [Anaerolineales bacterium]
MQRHQREGLTWYTFEQPGRAFRHALVTRHGGVSEGVFSSLNLGHTVGDDPEDVAANHRRLYRTWGITPAQVVSPWQVHGRHVVRVGRADGGQVIPETDALISAEPGVVLLLRFADCVPVLFFDPDARAVGLAHAGWRGAAAGVVPATVEALEEAFGSRRETLWAGVGPGIAPEDYEVGEEVVAAIARTLPPGTSIARQQGGRRHLDLPGAVAAQLREAGVGRVEVSRLHTSRNLDEWYSHRREEGRTGRFGVLVSTTDV